MNLASSVPWTMETNAIPLKFVVLLLYLSPFNIMAASNEQRETGSQWEAFVLQSETVLELNEKM